MADTPLTDFVEDLPLQRREYRAARVGTTEFSRGADRGPVATDDAMVGSEPMVADHLPGGAPAGYQRSGDPPWVKPSGPIAPFAVQTEPSAPSTAWMERSWWSWLLAAGALAAVSFAVTTAYLRWRQS
jgi:hypothetical protein